MKRITMGALVALAIAVLATLPLWQTAANAGNSGNGCKLQGTWIGETPYPLPGGGDYYNLKFFAVYHGTGDTEGTDVTEWINPVPDPGTSWSNARGTWEKTGPNRYEYTKLGFIVDDATGDVNMVARHWGTITLTDCNTALIDSTVEYLTPDMTPLMCVPATATIKRVVIQQPCRASQ